jgi:hypothetical protein
VSLPQPHVVRGFLVLTAPESPCGAVIVAGSPLMEIGSVLVLAGNVGLSGVDGIQLLRHDAVFIGQGSMIPSLRMCRRRLGIVVVTVPAIVVPAIIAVSAVTVREREQWMNRSSIVVAPTIPAVSAVSAVPSPIPPTVVPVSVLLLGEHIVVVRSPTVTVAATVVTAPIQALACPLRDVAMRCRDGQMTRGLLFFAATIGVCGIAVVLRGGLVKIGSVLMRALMSMRRFQRGSLEVPVGGIRVSLGERVGSPGVVSPIVTVATVVLQKFANQTADGLLGGVHLAKIPRSENS